MVFRDHRLSDLIGFVYSGMPAHEAANHLIENIKNSARPVLRTGQETRWFPSFSTEKMRGSITRNRAANFCAASMTPCSSDPEIEPVTISEAIARHKPDDFGPLQRLVPGSWINANFNVWIGAPEDNRAWDLLSEARDYYDRHAQRSRRRSASWRGKSCSSPRAATGTGGTVRNITRPTIRTSTNCIASISPTSITRWKAFRRKS